MPPHSKKFLWALAALVFVFFILLVSAAKKSLSIASQPVSIPLVATETTDVPIATDDPMLGNPGAPLTVVLFVDFGNTKDRVAYATIARFIRNHPRDARLVVKFAPSASFLFASTHHTVNVATYCALQNDTFWQYADKLATIKTLWRLAQLSDAAESVGYRAAQLQNCIQDQATNQALDALATSNKPLVTENPTVYVNNKRLHLTKDVDIESLLTSFITPTE